MIENEKNRVINKRKTLALELDFADEFDGFLSNGEEQNSLLFD